MYNELANINIIWTSALCTISQNTPLKMGLFSVCDLVCVRANIVLYAYLRMRSPYLVKIE